MKRAGVAVMAMLVIATTASLMACSQSEREPDTGTGGITAPASVGDTVEFDEGLSVTLRSVGSTPPADAPEVSQAVWLVFQVTNSRDTSVTLPPRPVKPEVIVNDGSHAPLNVTATSVSLTDGGGGLGPASGARGEPYLNPGRSMTAAFAVEEALSYSEDNSLAVTYAPTREGRVTFVFP